MGISFSFLTKPSAQFLRADLISLQLFAFRLHDLLRRLLRKGACQQPFQTRDLAEAMGKLNALNEGAVALADKVSKSQIRSPVRGRVQRLLANTVGGVVQPGKDIVEIVPLDDTLVLEARVAPKDIAFIRPDQAATVKFTAYDFSIYGGLEAKVENISPDTVVDERGNAFYLVRVRTLKPGFNDKLPIIPGMTAEVDVLTGKKTVLSYLLKPVLKVRDGALRER